MTAPSLLPDWPSVTAAHVWAGAPPVPIALVKAGTTSDCVRAPMRASVWLALNGAGVGLSKEATRAGMASCSRAGVSRPDWAALATAG